MKKETVQKSHEMYKKKIEEKKLADEMIIHDIHLTPMIFDADSSFYYTYFKINSLKDWELLKKVYDIHPLKCKLQIFQKLLLRNHGLI
jgi:hypothetical protein